MMAMKVFLNLLYLCIVTSIAANDTEKSETNTDSSEAHCTLPPHPAHGSFSSSPEAVPGDNLDSFRLNVTCNGAFKLTAIGEVSCSRGVWTQQMPTCRTFCLPPENKPIVFDNCVFASGEVFSAVCTPDDSKSETYIPESCVLPPIPKKGSYVSTPTGSPGAAFESYELTVTCEQGYELVGVNNVSCSSGRLSQPMPECLVPCVRSGDNGVEVIYCEKMETNDANITSTTLKTTLVTTTESEGSSPVQPTKSKRLHLLHRKKKLPSIGAKQLHENAEAAPPHGFCVLPPYPEHGQYSSLPSTSPDDNVTFFQLNVTCDHGFNLVGDERVQCTFGSMHQKMPVCLPYCKIEQQSIVSCEKAFPRCLFTRSGQSTLAPLSSKVESSYTDCGTTELLRRRREPVSGGYKPKINEFPWHTGIYRKDAELIMQICGGTLIAKRVVISAAHCFTQSRQKPLASNYAVAAGKIYRPWEDPADIRAQKNDVQKIKLPPRYQGVVANYQDDIAVVIPVEEFDFTDYVKPACLSFDSKFDDKHLTEGNLGKIAGWGLINEEAYLSRKLLAAYLPYISIDTCLDESPASFKSFITSDKICAGYSNGTSACRGDSGGGFVMAVEEEFEDRYFLRGVISTSPTTNKACNIYTWITFTHVLRHAEFIKSATEGVL